MNTKLSLGTVAEAAGLKRYTTGKCTGCGVYWFWQASAHQPLAAASCDCGKALVLTQKRTNVLGRTVRQDPQFDLVGLRQRELAQAFDTLEAAIESNSAPPRKYSWSYDVVGSVRGVTRALRELAKAERRAAKAAA